MFLNFFKGSNISKFQFSGMIAIFTHGETKRLNISTFQTGILLIKDYKSLKILF